MVAERPIAPMPRGRLYDRYFSAANPSGTVGFHIPSNWTRFGAQHAKMSTLLWCRRSDASHSTPSSSGQSSSEGRSSGPAATLAAPLTAVAEPSIPFNSSNAQSRKDSTRASAKALFRPLPWASNGMRSTRPTNTKPFRTWPLAMALICRRTSLAVLRGSSPSSSCLPRAKPYTDPTSWKLQPNGQAAGAPTWASTTYRFSIPLHSATTEGGRSVDAEADGPVSSEEGRSVDAEVDGPVSTEGGVGGPVSFLPVS